MKTSTVSLTVWFAQVLTLCALQETPLTTLDVSMTTSEQLTTKQDVRTKTAAMTTTTSADEMPSDRTPLTPSLELSGFPSLVGDDRRNTTISTTSHHNVMSLTEMVVSNTTSVTTASQETGTATESTSINIQETTEISISGTSIQLDHDVQTTTSTSWREDRTSDDTDEASTTAVPPTYSTYETDVTLTSGSYGTTDLQSPAPTTAGTSLSQQVSISTTRGNMNESMTNTTWRDEAWSTNTEDTWSTNTTTSKNMVNNGSYGTTDLHSPAPTTAGTYLEIHSTNQTPPDDTMSTVRPTSTSGGTSITSTPFRSTQVTSGSTENTEEPPMSSTKMMDWTTEENTEALSTTRGKVNDSTTNTTWRDGAWSTNTEDTWSTNTTTSKNISTSETEEPHWTTCFTGRSSSQPYRVSKLVCFVTMWSLGMTASIFLGLTVFLWVRLSVTKKRARISGRGGRDRKGHGPAVKEKQSLWAEPESSAEERVEFWYADGATVEDKRRYKARQGKTRNNGERQVGTEEDMLVQPKVTLKDITEFWHANGRARHGEEI
ncbi:uncharacterized protein si:ch73-248e21.5 [Ictalurus punctatus]|uniref:Uncharacterized protein si:ch73-248e21.5 n=1 Tax=Ictalurus punctatus TaxID=7998 RepID=A0A9F7R9W0_ICTPU|nr:uncharacterized protein si:ch73-248e21.5 [Ictalurus punctatus]XP_053532752.1 uncharacterized protein si:ch73-248e21.5 [Ictalurus punctatus]